MNYDAAPMPAPSDLIPAHDLNKHPKSYTTLYDAHHHTV